MQLDKTAGTLFLPGVNPSNPLDPNTATTGIRPFGSTIVRLQYTNGTQVVDTKVNAAQYEIVGNATLQTVTTNDWSNQRIYLAANNAVVVQYGQKTYNSSANALSGLTSEDFKSAIQPNTPIILRYILTVRGGATNLAITGDAIFTQASRFGELGGVVGSSSQSVSVFNPFISVYNKDLGNNVHNLSGNIASSFVSQYTGTIKTITWYNSAANGGNYSVAAALYECPTANTNSQTWTKIGSQTAFQSMANIGYVSASSLALPVIAGRAYYLLLIRNNTGSIVPQVLARIDGHNNVGSNISGTDNTTSPASFNTVIASNTMSGLTGGVAHSVVPWFQMDLS